MSIYVHTGYGKNIGLALLLHVTSRRGIAEQLLA